MQKLLTGVRMLIEALLTRRSAPASGEKSATDWLPPVLGPNDWSLGLMADRGASWYFDRH